jgi:plasmid maintenance system antidote protein VapI
MKNNANNVRIGENLRKAIFRAISKNPLLTQKNIASEAGIHPVTLSRILNGSGASNETIARIADVIGANAERIISIGRRTPKYTAKSLEEIVSDERILRQYVGPTDRAGLEWANTQLWRVVTALKNHRIKLQRERAYLV